MFCRVVGYAHPRPPAMVAMATPSDHRASRRVPTAAGSMLFLPIEAIPATWPPLPARCCSCRPMPNARHSCYLPCLLCRDRPPASCTVSADPPLLLADRRPAIRLARRTLAVSTDSILLLADRPKFARRLFSPPAARPSGLPAVLSPCQPTRCFFLPITGNLPVASSRRPPPDNPACPPCSRRVNRLDCSSRRSPEVRPSPLRTARRPTIRLARRALAVSTDSTLLADHRKLARLFFSPLTARPAGNAAGDRLGRHRGRAGGTGGPGGRCGKQETT